MTVYEMAQQAELEIKTAKDCLDTEVIGGYSGDLISSVIANAKQGNVWVTWHIHPNIVAAALVVKLAAVVVVSGRQPQQETIQKAQQEKVPILVSMLPAFETICKLHDIGI
ncbi:MAG: serine kinase [Sedimentisphaerales bacterium]